MSLNYRRLTKDLALANQIRALAKLLVAKEVEHSPARRVENIASRKAVARWKRVLLKTSQRQMSLRL